MTAVVVASPEELARVVRDAVADALKRAQPAPRAPLMDRKALAEWLNVKVRTVDALRARGMPHLLVGDCPRFEPAEVAAWLRVHAPAGVAGGSKCDPAEISRDSSDSRDRLGTVDWERPVTVRNHSGRQTVSASTGRAG